MFLTVREFVLQMYRLISASNPTIPLYGDDEKLAIQVLNQLMQSYASSGLMLTIAQTVTAPVNLGIQNIIFCDPSYPTGQQTETVSLISGTDTFSVVNGSIYAVGELVTGNGIPPFTTSGQPSSEVNPLCEQSMSPLPSWLPMTSLKVSACIFLVIFQGSSDQYMLTKIWI